MGMDCKGSTLSGIKEAAGKVRADMAELGVEVSDIALKDVILPGEMREILNQVVAVVQKRGLLVLGGPSAWKETRKGYNFFQGPDEAAVIRSGTRASLGQPSGGGSGRGVAPIEGDTPK